MELEETLRIIETLERIANALEKPRGKTVNVVCPVCGHVLQKRQLRKEKILDKTCKKCP